MPKTWPGVSGPGRTPKQPAPPCSPTPNPSPSPPPGNPGCAGGTRVRIIDLFYSEIPTADLGYFFREARVTYLPTGRAADGTGTILSYRVPDAQTLLISDVEFYAQTPNPRLALDISAEIHALVAGVENEKKTAGEGRAHGQLDVLERKRRERRIGDARVARKKVRQPVDEPTVAGEVDQKQVFFVERVLELGERGANVEERWPKLALFFVVMETRHREAERRSSAVSHCHVPRLRGARAHRAPLPVARCARDGSEAGPREGGDRLDQGGGRARSHERHGPRGRCDSVVTRRRRRAVLLSSRRRR